MPDEEVIPALSSAEALMLNLKTRRAGIQHWVDILSTWKAFLLFAIGGGVVVAIIAALEGGLDDAVLTGLAVLGGVVGGAVTWMYSWALLRMLLKTFDRQLLLTGAEKLQENIEDDFFTKLVKINFKYIDQYYLQTQAQADKSFLLAAIVALLAFGVIVTGVVMMFLNYTQPAYVTAASGVLAEFVAAVFFYLYNRTIVKMGEYHQKLVLTQNISLALKIAEGLPEQERTRAQEMLIDRLTEDVNRLLVQVPQKTVDVP